MMTEHSSHKLQDSVYSSCLVKLEPRMDVEADGKSTALKFFRSMENIDKFIQHNDSALNEILVCSGCSEHLLTTIERAYKQFQEQARSYSVTIHEFKMEHAGLEMRIEKDGMRPKHNSDDTESFLLSPQTEECELDLQVHLKDIEQQRGKTLSEIEKELLLLASIESEVAFLDSEISSATDHSQRVVRESKFLQSSDGSLSALFDLSISSHRSAPSLSSSEKSNSHRSGEGGEITSVINGTRLMYLPSHADNLNWAEINQAWSCLSFLVCCIRNHWCLSEKSIIVFDTDGADSDSSSALKLANAPLKTRLSIRLRPLRRRTLILLSLDHGDQSDEADISEEVLFLCGEGSIDSPGGSGRHSHDRQKHDVCDDAEDEPDDFVGLSFNQVPTLVGYQRLQYYRAVVALAAVVCATARDLGRIDCLSGPLCALDLAPLLDAQCNRSHDERGRSYLPGELVEELCISVKSLMRIQ
jgi:hypothetical protein